MPDNGSIQKRGAHEMAHGRPVQITEHTTVTELQPSLSDVVCANKKLQIGFIVALVVLALLSGFVARPHFADTKTWDSTIEVIDQKKGNVLALTTSCVALSAGITALPGDTGTPVAEQLAQLSGNLGIVLAVLYLEKISADYFVVGWPGHPDSVCAGALCSVAWYSRTLEHQRRHSPRGNACAGGRHNWHGVGACKRMGVAKGRRNVSRSASRRPSKRRPTLRARQIAIAPKQARKRPSPQSPRTCLSSLPTVPRVSSRR